MQNFIRNSNKTNRIRQALINLEGWDSLDIEYSIPSSCFVESIVPLGECVGDNWGCLGYLED